MSSLPSISGLFSPLGPDFCLWFYFLSVAAFVLFFFILLTAVVVGITQKKGFMFYYLAFLGSLGYLFFYLQNRILFSMCQKSL